VELIDIYHIWCNLRDGVSDTAFAADVDGYLGFLKSSGKLSGYRLTRRKLGLGTPQLGEFHIIMEFEGLSHLDEALNHVASRSDPVESFHHAVTSKATDLQFALYRDFPDAVRETGQEKF
jgi:hypothetical protein